MYCPDFQLKLIIPMKIFQVFLVNLNRKSPTRVNGKKIYKACRLVHMALIEIGGRCLRYEADGNVPHQVSIHAK